MARRHWTAALLCFLLLLCLLSAAAYSAHEAGHDCRGADCPVCQVLRSARLLSALDILGSALLFALRPSHGALLCEAGIGPLPACCTLVGLKVRLDD